MTNHPTERAAITNIQTYLRQLSYEDHSIPSPPIDGIFDKVTENALKAFQQKKDLPQSGIADRTTFNKLYEDYLYSINRFSSPFSPNLFPRTPEGYAVSFGDEYFLVGVIQLLLNELRIIYDSFIPLVVNGIFDEATQANVADFQGKNLLTPDGRVDKETWNRLVRAYNDRAADQVR